MASDTVQADPIRRFEAEHEIALAALDRLERAALALRAGDPAELHLATAREVHQLLCSEVRDHNEAEERALFPLLGENAPLDPFLEEHQTLWGLESELAGAIEEKRLVETSRLALEIVDLLRAHIRRENEVLFPMARAFLGPTGLEAVARRLG